MGPARKGDARYSRNMAPVREVRSESEDPPCRLQVAATLMVLALAACSERPKAEDLAPKASDSAFATAVAAYLREAEVLSNLLSQNATRTSIKAQLDACELALARIPGQEDHLSAIAIRASTMHTLVNLNLGMADLLSNGSGRNRPSDRSPAVVELTQAQLLENAQERLRLADQVREKIAEIRRLAQGL